MKTFSEFNSDSDYQADILMLETKDFLSHEDNTLKHRGSRFEYCLIPKEFKNTYKDYPIYNSIMGSIYVGTRLRANIIFY